FDIEDGLQVKAIEKEVDGRTIYPLLFCVYENNI
ncbi:TPA: DUF2628 domain-containing protein, partial [Bacillus cereus]